MPIKIVGVDLVGMFDDSRSERLEVVKASLTDWRPDDVFDLITCVHGLHYIGDKLNLIASIVSWLAPSGKFAAHLDMQNLRLEQVTGNNILTSLRNAGFRYSPRHKLIECAGHRKVCFPYRYLGADDQAGPNYTGQAAVNSYYVNYRHV